MGPHVLERGGEEVEGRPLSRYTEAGGCVATHCVPCFSLSRPSAYTPLPFIRFSPLRPRHDPLSFARVAVVYCFIFHASTAPGLSNGQPYHAL